MLALSLLLEVALLFPLSTEIRRYIAALNLIVVSYWVGYVLVSPAHPMQIALIIVALFRSLNFLKIIRANLHPDYLLRITRQTSFTLILATLLLIYIQSILSLPLGERTAIVLVFGNFTFAVFLLAVTAKNLQKTRHHQTAHYYSDKELPTVTVAIPARNETNDMAACLRTILANDYPKLEVLVLDDCSQDRTAEIIRDFAQDGVRFIAGKPPKDRWLAKNQAYEQLFEHASGEIILFCGVDVRFGAEAIRSLVTTSLNKKRRMMSVMPFRIGGGADTSLIQPLRYWWELALPRRVFNRPPVLSTCWLIERKALKQLGGFKAVSNNILPERYFARELIKNDSYAFIRADEHLDVRTVKPIEEQIATAIRTRYPELKKRPENVLMLLAAEILLLGTPIALAVQAALNGLSVITLLGVLSAIFIVLSHYLIMSASNPTRSLIAIINFPFALLTEFVLTFLSMYQYEFGKVIWKGRNVCIPAMHVVKKLPPV